MEAIPLTAQYSLIESVPPPKKKYSVSGAESPGDTSSEEGGERMATQNHIISEAFCHHAASDGINRKKLKQLNPSTTGQEPLNSLRDVKTPFVSSTLMVR